MPGPLKIRQISPGVASDPGKPPLSSPHVLLVVDGFPKSLGGGERVLLRLAELLPRSGFRVSILTFRVDPESSVLKGNGPCTIYLLPLEQAYSWHGLRAGFEFGRFLRDQDVRLVMTFFESSDLWAGPFTRLFSRARLVWNRRDMGILRAHKHRAAYRLLARAPHRTFCVSEKVRQYTLEVDRVPADRVETVYNGLDLSRFREKARRVGGQGMHITTVGNVRRVKGHDVLLRAAAEVLAVFPETRFSIGGEVLEPEFAAELGRLAEELGIEDQVTFVGGVRDLPAHLAMADVFVLPSRSEGFSNAILEGMASGLPIVATDVGGNAEAVLDGVTGLIVPPEDARSLAAALLRLVADPERAETMGALGRERAVAKFSEEAILQQIATAFRRLLS